MRQLIFIFLFTFLLYNIASTQNLAPDFKVTTTKGQQLNLYADYLDQGKTVVLELFWEGCPPCNAFAPLLGGLYKDWGNGSEGVEFIAMDILDSEDDSFVEKFQNRHGHTWPGVSYVGGSLDALMPYTASGNSFGTFLGTPTIIIIGPDKMVAYGANGFKRDAAGIALLDAAIAATRQPAATTTTLSGGIQTNSQKGIGNVALQISAGVGATATIVDAIVLTDAEGRFSLPDLLIDQPYTVRPEKNTRYDNGVTTFDLVLISKHILGVDTFTLETQKIASDANLSGDITTFDVVLLRKLILGIDTTLPAGSWRFLPAQIDLPSLNDLSNISFTGIKMGDVNDSADLSLLNVTVPRSSNQAVSLMIGDKAVKAGELIEVPFATSELDQLQGFQFTLDFEPTTLQFLGIKEVALANFSEANTNIQHKEQGKIAMSWFDTQSPAIANMFTLQFKAQKDGLLSELLALNSSITKAEAYSPGNELLEIDLKFLPIKETTILTTTIFPNPIGASDATLSKYLEHQETAEIAILSVEGKAIHQLSYKAQEKGSHSISLPTATLEKGIYFVKINTSKGTLDYVKLLVD